jgi:outer membrane protein TolC
VQHPTIPRALAALAWCALVLAAVPAPAQTTPGGMPATTPTPRPAGSASPAPGAPSGTSASGGSGAVDASQIMTLEPAGQTSPLPFPAYGTPAPASAPHTDSGVPQTITLQQSILIAYARSPVLAAARAQVAIATAPVSLAQSALFPSLTGSASTTHSRDQVGSNNNSNNNNNGNGNGNGTTNGPIGPNSTSNRLSADLAQLVYDGGRVAAQIRGARATESASIATYQRALQTVAFNVATAYYNALSAQRQTQVDLATVQLDQVQENLVAANIRAGTEARADLSTAQLPTAQARVAVIRAQANERVMLATFANTLGIDAAVAVQPKDDVPSLSASSGTLAVSPAFPTPSYDQAYARAVALRPDLTASQQNVVSFQENLRFARLGLWPSINASGSYGTASTSVGGGDYRNAASIGLALSVPIYDRGVTRAQTAQAQGQLDNAIAQLVTTQEGIQLGIHTALVNLVAAYAALDQTNAELAKAQEVLRSTDAQYKAGVTTLPLLLNAQVGITQALTDEVSAAYAVRQAEQALLYAEGANAAG